MAGKPQKNLAYSVLLDFYGLALTEKQRAILTEYYDEDLSLAEIAENFGITRQGVRDIIVRAEKTLEDIEEKTGLIQRYHRTRATTAVLRTVCDQIQARGQALGNDPVLEDLCQQLRRAIDDLERE